MKITEFFAFFLLVLGCLVLVQPTIVVAQPTTPSRVAWIDQFGTSTNDASTSISVDGLGNVYISGQTLGSLGGINAGGPDAFIVKFSDPVPEPSTLLLGTMASVGLLMRRRVSCIFAVYARRD